MKYSFDLDTIPQQASDKVAYLELLEKSYQKIIGILDINQANMHSNKTLLEWGWEVVNKDEIHVPLYRKHKLYLLKVKMEDLSDLQYYLNENLVLQAHAQALSQKNDLTLKVEQIDTIYNFIKDLEKTKKIKAKSKAKLEKTAIGDKIEPAFYDLAKIQTEEFDLVFDSEHNIWDEAKILTNFKKNLAESRKLVGKLIKDHGIEVAERVLQELKTKKPEEVFNVTTFCLTQGKKYQLERIRQLGAKEKRSKLVL